MNMGTLDKNKIFFYGIVGLFIFGYIFLTLNAPVSPSTRPEFQLGDTQRVLLRLSFSGLMAVVWILGAVAVRRGFIFAQKTQDKEFRKFLFNLSLGFGILLLGFILATLVGQIKAYHPDDQDTARMITIIVNYIYVLAQLLGFWFLYKGASSGWMHKKVEIYNKNILVGVILTLVIGGLWSGLLLTNVTRQTFLLTDIDPTFHINGFAVIFTIIIPTLFGWFFGILASFALSDLSVGSTSLALNKALSKLVSGVWLLILSFIVLFGILSMGTERLLAVGMVGILLIIYVFIFILLFAYLYTAISFKNLQKYKEDMISYESGK